VQFWGLLRVLVTMGWSDDSKNARGGRGRQRAKTKEEQRIFDLNFGLRPNFFPMQLKWLAHLHQHQQMSPK
jgi:hypothetical protein